jgi:hypothetical protein
MVSIYRARPVSIRWLATLALIVLTAANAPAFAGPVSKFTNDGAFARMWGQSGCFWVYLDVSRGGPKQTPQTWLSYEVYDHCANWELVGYGYGNVPNSTFTTGNKRAELSVSTGNTPGLFTFGATGAISVSFAQDGAYQQSFTGHSTVSYPGTTIRWHGSSSFATAGVAGTLLGVDVTQVSGEIGEGRDRQMTIERAAK